MISARKAKIKSIKNKAIVDGVNFAQIKHLKRLINTSVNKAAKKGLFTVKVSLLENMNVATISYLKSILLSNCFIFEISKASILLKWD